jgi:hypothetical protein
LVLPLTTGPFLLAERVDSVVERALEPRFAVEVVLLAAFFVVPVFLVVAIYSFGGCRPPRPPLRVILYLFHVPAPEHG